MALMTQTTSKLDSKVEAALTSGGLTYRVFECDPELADTQLFCEHYGFSLQQAANTLLTASRSEPIQFAACIVLATTRLDVNKKVSQLMNVKKVSFASQEQTVSLTGMQLGGVTPFGLPDLPIYVDAAVMQQDEVITGGGNRSSKVFLAPQELLKLPNVVVVENLAVPRVAAV
jgi:prolyl-tRNA editing enzyme YbaK/EbsC (Cys-tRNA(Pro) deacylase)